MITIKSPKIALFILLVINQFIGLSQEREYNRDSVKAVLSSQQSPEEKSKSFIYLGESFFFTRTDSSIFYYEKAYELMKFSSADLILSNITTQLGVLYQNIDPAKSAKFTIESVDYSENSGNAESIVRSHILLGNTFRSNGELEKAMDEYQYCLEIEEDENDSLGIARIYNNIGIVHMMSGKYDIGIEYWLQSLELKLALNDLASAASTMANIGLYYKDIERYDEAKNFLSQALAINLELRDFESIAFNYTVIGRMHQKLGEKNEAIKKFYLAIDYCDSNQVQLNKEEAYLGLSECFADLGKYKLAYEMHNEFTLILQDLFDERNSQLTRELTAKFESEKKEQELQLLQAENDAQVDLLKKEEEKAALTDSKNVYLSLGLLLAGLLIVSVIFILVRVRKAKRQIEAQKHLVEEKNREITDSISYAKRLQDAILPLQSTIDEVLPENFVLYLPKDIVAGDFYWIEQKGDVVLFAAADCTGHGVPGAMVSVVCHNALNRSVREFNLLEPGLILNKVRDLVVETFEKSAEEVKDGMDICLCAINKKTGEVKYAGANNSLYRILPKSNEILELKADKQPVGKFEKNKPFNTTSFQSEKGEMIYLFTDGYADQFGGEKGKKMKYKSFKSLLLTVMDENEKTQKDTLESAFNDWKMGYEQIDDVCVVGIRL